MKAWYKSSIGGRMFYLIATAILILGVAGSLLRQPHLIKTPPVLTWIGLTIISIIFLFNQHTLPFALPLQAVALATLSIMLSRKKKNLQKKWPRGQRPTGPAGVRRKGRTDMIIGKMISLRNLNPKDPH